jgi:2-isopropylmalate synthase
LLFITPRLPLALTSPSSRPHLALTSPSSLQDSGKQLTSTATVTLIDRSKGEGAEAGTQTMRAAIGIGPVDATYKAILSVIGKPIMLTKYQVTKIEGGSGPDAPGNDALASVITQIKQMRQGDVQAAPMPVDFPGHMGATVRPVVNALGGNELGIVKAAGPSDVTYTGIGTSTDIIVASARAYIAAINRMIENEANEEAATKRRAKAATGAA